MAQFIRNLNAKIRSNPTLSYFCSTHFWGPASNFGIPLAAVMDTQKSPDLISGQMTGALILYSTTFMRYAFAVTPINYLLFACHFVNEGAQLTQAYRYITYHYRGGKEAAIEAAAADAKNNVVAKAEGAKEGLQELVKKAKDTVAK